jgi:hypothetical protein
LYRYINVRFAHYCIVSLIDGDEKGYFVRGLQKRKSFRSADGSEILKMLQMLYGKKVVLRRFAVLVVTIVYLPIVRLCVHAFECVETSEGTRLVHDVDVECDSYSHIIVQAAAAVLLLLFGVGVPCTVCWRIRNIIDRRELKDARTLDAWGALYDAYRQPVTSDQSDQIEKGVVVADAAEVEFHDVEVEFHDTDEVENHTAAAKMQPQTTFERWCSFVSINYLAVELLQKMSVVLAGTFQATTIKASLLFLIYLSSAGIVFSVQPFKADSIGGCTS